jgi:hypothetical protein
MEKRYQALRIIANIYRVIGYILLVLTILAVIATCAISVISGTALETITNQFGVTTRGSTLAGTIFGGFLIALGIIIYGGMLALSLIAMAEGIYLLIAVEENTRKTAMLLEGHKEITPAQPQA